MLRNTAKDKLRAGEAIFGPIIGFNSPHLVEICGRVGFDFIFIDCEHGAITTEGCEAMVRAAEVAGVPTIVRVPENSPHVILRYLDTGALGVQVPHVTSRAEAEAVVAAVKYAPLGQRGIAGGRWADYGLTGGLGEAIKFANEQTLISLMIEDVAGVRNLDEIVSVEGVDILAVGPADLSASLGYPGNVNEPKVQQTIDEIVRRVNAAGKVVGVGGNSEIAGVKRNLARGARYITLGLPGFLANVGREFLRQAREVPAAG